MKHSYGFKQVVLSLANMTQYKHVADTHTQTHDDSKYRANIV